MATRPAGGEEVHPIGRDGESRVAKAVIISAVRAVRGSTAANPVVSPNRCLTDCRRSSPPIGPALLRRGVGPFDGENWRGAKPLRARLELVASGHDGRREAH